MRLLLQAFLLEDALLDGPVYGVHISPGTGLDDVGADAPAHHLVPLDLQDRSKWDRELIRRGFACLVRSTEMDAVAAARYHLEAAIASRHCSAETFEKTDWISICLLYDRLMEIDPSPLIELNRAVALSYRDGPEAAVPIVERLLANGELPNRYAGVAVLANLHMRAGSRERARPFLDEALKQARTSHERDLIARQIEHAVRRV